MAYISFKPQDYYNTKLYDGTGASNAVTGVGFTPDFVWCKDRDGDVNSSLCDTVRAATKTLISNTNGVEETYTEGLKSFDADGFTVGTQGFINTNTNNYVSYNWKAGTTTVPSGGSITPSAVTINTTSKQGIYKYTGTGANATIAHGLSAVPEFMMVKNLDTTNDWQIYHMAKGADWRAHLNTTAAFTDNATGWNDTAPTSTLFSLGTNTNGNQSGDEMIAYVWAGVKGYSKFGMYECTGISSATPYIWTGFRPAWIMIKSYNNTHNWAIYDDKRLGQNATSNKGNASISANLTSTEQKDDDIDIFANGFRPRVTSNQVNGSSWLYAYAAFASNPMVGSNGNAVLGR